MDYSELLKVIKNGISKICLQLILKRLYFLHFQLLYYVLFQQKMSQLREVVNIYDPVFPLNMLLTHTCESVVVTLVGRWRGGEQCQG